MSRRYYLVMEEKTKLRVKLGQAEIEYEGGIDFLHKEVMPAINKMMRLVETEADLRKVLPPPIEYATPQKNLGGPSIPPSTVSTNTLASVTSAESATDLAVVASARLIMVEGKDPISRQDILDEMRTATTYFKKSFVNNHSNTLKVLVKADRLRLVADDSYTLSPKERKSLEDILIRAVGDDLG